MFSGLFTKHEDGYKEFHILHPSSCFFKVSKKSGGWRKKIILKIIYYRQNMLP